MSIKVVIDTNILVAGLIGSQGPDREILRQYFKGELKPVIGELSTRILVEEEAKQQFLAAQLRGKRQRGLRMLDELDSFGLLLCFGD